MNNLAIALLRQGRSLYQARTLAEALWPGEERGTPSIGRRWRRSSPAPVDVAVTCELAYVDMAHESGSRGQGRAIILVVDHDPHVRELESHFLTQAGYSVGFEQDGDAALEQARKNLPDIIITEILVPNLDGLTLCRRLKADPQTRDVSVLVFSILAAAGRAREAGADAFLLKPLAEHALVDTVQQLLEARNERIERIPHD